jgi:tRNA-dihydrouridine synthase
MQDTNYGWTVEMQIKAAQNKLRYTEVPVSYKVRIGVSKVSGTLKGTIMASYKILFTIFKYALMW